MVPKATFITVGHPVDPPERSRFLTGAPIDVADNVWIGAGATILPGVRIGRDAVVAAGAVVVDDVPNEGILTLDRPLPGVSDAAPATAELRFDEESPCLAARLVTRTDRQKERMWCDMLSKVEIG